MGDSRRKRCMFACGNPPPSSRCFRWPERGELPMRSCRWSKPPRLVDGYAAFASAFYGIPNFHGNACAENCQSVKPAIKSSIAVLLSRLFELKRAIASNGLTQCQTVLLDGRGFKSRRPDFAGFRAVRLTSRTAVSLPGLDLRRSAYGSNNQSIAA